MRAAVGAVVGQAMGCERAAGCGGGCARMPGTRGAGKPLKGHNKPVTCLAWEPLHCMAAPPARPAAAAAGAEAAAAVEEGERSPWHGLPLRVASGSKDGTVRIWNVLRGRSGAPVRWPLRLPTLPRPERCRCVCSCIATLSGHTASVQSIVWGGQRVFALARACAAAPCACCGEDGGCVYGALCACRVCARAGQGLLYSASQDRTIGVWDTQTAVGKLVRVLKGAWLLDRGAAARAAAGCAQATRTGSTRSACPPSPPCGG